MHEENKEKLEIIKKQKKKIDENQENNKIDLIQQKEKTK